MDQGIGRTNLDDFEAGMVDFWAEIHLQNLARKLETERASRPVQLDADSLENAHPLALKSALTIRVWDPSRADVTESDTLALASSSASK